MGPLLVAPAPGHEPPDPGADLHVQVGQQPRRAADGVGADAPGGEFGQERQRQLREDDAGRLQRVDARKRAEPSGRSGVPRHGLRP